MYKIIGADGKEYGPITAEQLKQWVAEGRANAQTKVLPEGATEWKPFGEIPELAATLPLPVLSPTPAPGGVSAADQVRGPAIFLLVLSVLDILASLTSIAFAVFQVSLPELLHLPAQNGQFDQKFALLLGLPVNCIGLVIRIACFVGALRMLKLRNYGLAMTAAILTMIPCGSCCCLINIGAGIWALIVLSKPEVKSQFN